MNLQTNNQVNLKLVSVNPAIFECSECGQHFDANVDGGQLIRRFFEHLRQYHPEPKKEPGT